MRTLPLISLLALCGCWSDAEHLNPLDPLSAEFENVGAIDGTVADRGFRPLEGVVVSLSPGGATATTNAAGQFIFDAVEPGSYTLAASREDLEPEAANVVVTLATSTTTSLTLNHLPSVSSGTMVTSHISRWWPANDLYRLDIAVDVADADGIVDIGGVSLSLPHLSFAVDLQPSAPAGTFSITLSEEEIPGSTVHELSGHPFYFSVTDQFGSSVTDGPWFISRIIDYEPETSSPSGSQEVPGGTPLLTWVVADVPFSHTYLVEVYRVDAGVETRVLLTDGIDGSSNSVQLSEALATGQYYWTVSVVDGFGNRSRSREAGFIVP